MERNIIFLDLPFPNFPFPHLSSRRFEKQYALAQLGLRGQWWNARRTGIRPDRQVAGDGDGGRIDLRAGNLFTCTGAATFAGTLNISGATGTGELMAYNSHAGVFTMVTGLPSGDRLAYTPTQLDIVVSAGTCTWASAVSGNWSDASKWTGGVPNAIGAGAVINVPTSSARTVTLDAPQTVGTLLLGNSASSTLGYTLSGSGANTLTLNNFGSGATIMATGGSHVIGAPVVLADNLTLSGSGTLRFSGASSITDGGLAYGLTMNGAGSKLILGGSNRSPALTTISAGTLQIPAGGSLGNTAISVANGATFAPTPGSGFIVAGSSGIGSAGATLNLNAGAVFDMTDGAIGSFHLNQQSGFAGPALTLAGATLKFDLSSSGADSLLVNQGAVAVSGTNTINITGLGSSLTPGGTYTLISAAGGLNGTLLFANRLSSEILTVGGTSYDLTLNSSGTAETVQRLGRELADARRPLGERQRPAFFARDGGRGHGTECRNRCSL